MPNDTVKLIIRKQYIYITFTMAPRHFPPCHHVIMSLGHEEHDLRRVTHVELSITCICVQTINHIVKYIKYAVWRSVVTRNASQNTSSPVSRKFKFMFYFVFSSNIFHCNDGICLNVMHRLLFRSSTTAVVFGIAYEL